MNFFWGIFYILHGLVHLLYLGHSLNYFELEKGFNWPGNSKLFAKIFGFRTKKMLAGIWCVFPTVGFVLSGFFKFTGDSFLNQVVIFAVISSSLLFMAFWDGSRFKLHTQGGIALLINILILVITLT